MWRQPTPTEESEHSPRLQLAAFPNIGIASITDAELGGDGLAALWNWIPGLVSSRDRTLYLSVTGVETQEIDDRTATKRFQEYLETHNNPGNDSQNDGNEFQRGVCSSAAALGDPDGVSSHIVVVTRVFYARGIKYVYANTAAAALQVAATGDSGSEVSTVDEERLQAERNGADASTLASVSKEQVVNASPGVVARFAFANANTLGLEEIFEKPMAFGADVLKFPLSKLRISCRNLDVLSVESDRTVLSKEKPDGT